MFSRARFPIFRIAGIQIFIDRSWFFVFVLVTWSLATGLFPAWHPNWNPLLTFALAVCAALLFFGSVLLHELAHALVAKARGLEVRSISLFLFGGVSNIEREPQTPRTEFLMAIVGPITSVGIGLIFLFAGTSMGSLQFQFEHPLNAMSQLNPLATVLMWLGSVNLLVGIFNLIPGFPLDGGRVLRSAIWAGTHDYTKATNIAARVGRLIGWGFMFAGVWMIVGVRVPFFGSGLFNGMWLIFIGWFLQSAAEQSREQAVIHNLLADVPVEKFLRDDIPSVPAETNVQNLVEQWFMKSDEKSFPVTIGSDVVGIVTLLDVRRVPRHRWQDTRVADIMTRLDQLAVVRPEEDTAEAYTLLNKTDMSQLPVMKNGHFMGMVRARDIARWLQLQKNS
jgi:Zn-dependent protease/predicted transcriptional regulator